MGRRITHAGGGFSAAVGVCRHLQIVTSVAPELPNDIPLEYSEVGRGVLMHGFLNVLAILMAGIAFLSGSCPAWGLSTAQAGGQNTRAAGARPQLIDDRMPAGTSQAEAGSVQAPAGVFYRPDNGGQIEMRKTQASESKAGDIDRFLMNAGLGGLNATYIYAGGRADLQIKEKKPVFRICGTGVGKDAVIVQLTQKKDSRTIQTNSAEASSDNRMGYRRSDIFRLSLSAADREGCHAAKPDLELKPGEYLLSIGSSLSTYDFGITAESK